MQNQVHILSRLSCLEGSGDQEMSAMHEDIYTPSKRENYLYTFKRRKSKIEDAGWMDLVWILEKKKTWSEFRNIFRHVEEKAAARNNHHVFTKSKSYLTNLTVY